MKIDRKTFLQFLAGLAAAPLSAIGVAPSLHPGQTAPAPHPMGAGLEGEVAIPASTQITAITLLPEPELWLQEWLAAARIPLLTSDDPTERFFVRAIGLKHPVPFAYFGGAQPGAIRDVHPVLLYRISGYPSAYLTAYCLERHEIRTFRLDRIDLAVVETTVA